jgi:hypothetical protein
LTAEEKSAQKCLSCLQTKENIREPSTLDDEWIEIDQPDIVNISTPEALQELENFMSGFDQQEIAAQIAQAMQDIELA